MSEKMQDLGYDYTGFAERCKEAASQKNGTCKLCGDILDANGKCTIKCGLQRKITEKPVEALKSCGVPRLYQEATKCDWGETGGKYKLICGEAQDTYLFGSCGTGKTHLAATLIKEWLSQFVKKDCYDAKWISAPYFLAKIRETYGSHATESELAVINQYSKFGLLVIDDLGAEKVTDWSISALYQLISNRINECKITIVTSNLSLNQLAEWNERISSRMSGFFIGEMQGQDRRLDSKKG